MEFTWGDVVRVSWEAEWWMRPGELASVVGIAAVETDEQVARYRAEKGQKLYLIEFGDGSSIELLDVLLLEPAPEI